MTFNRSGRQKYKSSRLKKVSFVFFILFSFWGYRIHSQQAYITGMVKDSLSGEALIGVVVQAGSTGAITDVGGNYSLKADSGEIKVSFRYVSYRNEEKTVHVNAGETVKLDLLMVNDSKTMGIVVVSSGRYEQNIGEVPVSMEVLKPKLIENKGTTTMETIMDQVPGVSMTDGQANIRGGSGYSYGSGSRVLLVVDDMPLLSGDAGDVKWNYLPIENVSQVEVMKGASSALFGSSALNGVIHFRTAYPTDHPQTTISLINGFYGDPERASLKWWGANNPVFNGINFSHLRQVGNFDLVIGGHLYNDQGYRYLETEQRERLNVNTRYRFKKIPGLSAGINTNMMRTTGGLFIIWYNDSLAYTPSGNTLQHYTNYRWNVDPFIVWATPKGHHHALRTRYFETKNLNDTKQSATAGFYYAEYQYQYRFNCGVTFTAGAVGTRTLVRAELYPGATSEQTPWYGKLFLGDSVTHTSTNLSGYFQADKKFFDKLFVTIGVRGEYFKLDTAKTNYDLKISKSDTLHLPFRPVVRIGVNYQIAEATYLRISYGQGYRFPCIAEKFIRTETSGLEIYPNLNLQPEDGQSAEIGVKQGFRITKNWKGYGDAAIYWMQYHNMMEFAFHQWGNPMTDPFFGFGFKSLNVGTTRIRGVDMSVMGQGQIGKFGVSLLAGYTYMDPISLTWTAAKDTNIANPGAGTAYYNILKYRYKHIAKFDGEVSYKKFSVGASMRYNSYMENIDKIFLVAVPGIAAYREKFHTGDLVFDTRIMYQLNDVTRISFIANNIFNREYTQRPADVQPPRNFAMQVVLKF